MKLKNTYKEQNMYHRLTHISELNHRPKLMLLNLMITQLAVIMCLIVFTIIVLIGSYENNKIIKDIKMKIKDK